MIKVWIGSAIHWAYDGDNLNDAIVIGPKYEKLLAVCNMIDASDKGAVPEIGNRIRDKECTHCFLWYSAMKELLKGST